jgi:hypothetical protein
VGNMQFSGQDWRHDLLFPGQTLRALGVSELDA